MVKQLDTSPQRTVTESRHTFLKRCLRTGSAGALGLVAAIGSAQAADFTPRVVGGVSISIDVTPSIVGLLNKERLATSQSSFQAHFCGGTVIADEWVLTAAHCLVDGEGNEVAPSELTITMGANELDGGSENFIDVTDVIVHEAYVNTVAGDDIALLRLASVATVPAAVLEANPVALNDEGLIAGWGALNAAEVGPQQFPRILQGALVSIAPADFCGNNSTLFPDYFGRIRPSQFCAGVPSGGIDTCQGDSGGPIFKRYEDQSLTLAGITSWGISCALAESPGVYTRVGAYIDWIQNSINNAVEPSTNPDGGLVDDDATPGGISGGGGSGGGAMAAMLPLMLLIAFVRRSSRRPRLVKRVRALGRGIVVAAGSFSLLGCMSAQPLVAGDSSMLSLQMLEQSLGTQFTEKKTELNALWGSEAECSSQRTGVGFTRRAYFLDSCTFANATQIEVCDRMPTQAVYHYLEQSLVQINLVFADPVGDCAMTEAADGGYAAVEQLGSEQRILAQEGRVLMLNEGADAGLVVEGESLIVMRPDVAPNVHVLKGMLAASTQ